MPAEQVTIDFVSMSNHAILEELGERVRRHRLNQNIAQAGLAEKAGVARSVVQNLERGEDCTLNSVIRILRGLGALDQLDSFIPDPGFSPVQLARLEGRQRQRASGRRGRARKGRR